VILLYLSIVIIVIISPWIQNISDYILTIVQNAGLIGTSDKDVNVFNDITDLLNHSYIGYVLPHNKYNGYQSNS